ncbi:MAG: CoA transferase, partial [Acidobacteria bacterium]|nr:CoA transferase [Acidobacteriota bacterium]
VLCSVIGEPLFRRWVDLMAEDNGAGGEGEEIDWLDDPRFADDLSRGDHGDVIGKRMSAWCASRSTGEAVETLNAAMIPSGPVYSMQQTLDDPHIAEVGSFVELEYPDMPRPAPVAQPSVRLTETPASIRHRAPTLGEHTDEILGDLGYTADEIAAFRAERVV